MDTRWVFAFAVLLAVFSTGDSLKCYSCGTGVPSLAVGGAKKNSSCEHRAATECAENELCLTIESEATILNEKVKSSIPYCGTLEICKFYDSDVYKCRHCSTDLCNTSPVIVPSAVVMIAFTAFRFLF